MGQQQETRKQAKVCQQQDIDRGVVCTSDFCSWPEPDDNGWCFNCGYPVTDATRKSWEGFQSVDPQHQALLNKLK